ncbi:MAG TPA: fused MFS/spermidine synthase [Solirubrobacterales bacterium]|nr:fused MFS/spermidine synthase [Solirubrobacterales bacterium]
MARGKRTRARRAAAVEAEVEQTETPAGEDGSAAKPPPRPKSARKPAQGRAAADAGIPSALPPVGAAALVFVAAGAVLMLEILAVRLLAPYVGLTLETTTSIIGAALAGIAIGAAVGGHLADRTNTRMLIVGLLVGGGLLTLLTVPVVRWLGPGATGDGDLAALGITALALVPAAAVLSAVSPAVAHLQLHDLKVSGTIVGRLSAWATAGALIGTFGTGFIVIPLMPASTAVLTIGLVLVGIGIVVGTRARLLSSAALFAVAVLAFGFGGLSAASDSPCITETNYHCLDLEHDPTTSNPAYNLILDGTYNSYVVLNDPDYLAFAYTRWIARAIDAAYSPKKPLDAVFVGGGGFTMPRWLEATRPGSKSITLEVDGDLVDLDEEKLGLEPSPDLQVRVGDARVTMLDIPDDSADVVVGDAFSGFTVPWHLTTEEWIDEVKRVLRPNGIYTLNLIDDGPMDLIRAEAATLLKKFEYIRLITFSDRLDQPVGGNIVLVASDRPLPKKFGPEGKGAFNYDQAFVEQLAISADPLRDDYAPVDQLRTEE